MEEAYQNLLMVGRRPVAVLLVEVSPEDVDVNVNPSKAEVRFKKDPGDVQPGPAGCQTGTSRIEPRAFRSPRH